LRGERGALAHTFLRAKNAPRFWSLFFRVGCVMRWGWMAQEEQPPQRNYKDKDPSPFDYAQGQDDDFEKCDPEGQEYWAESGVWGIA
jgi:hypothetical protein